MREPQVLTRRMVELWHTDPGFSVSFLDLFAHGVDSAGSELCISRELALDVARANASLAGWTSPVGIAEPELAFLRSFATFLATTGLAAWSSQDCFAGYRSEGGLTKPLAMPLTPSGRRLAGHIARLAAASPNTDVHRHTAASGGPHRIDALAAQLATVKQRAFEADAAADVDQALEQLAAGRLGVALALAWRARRFDLSNAAACAIVRAVQAEVADQLPQLGDTDWLSPVERVEGWLSSDEAGLLARCVAGAPAQPDGAVIEIGSYKGRSTLAIALAISQLCRPYRLMAIDPHDGYAFGDGSNTRDALVETLRANAVAEGVDVICGRSTEVTMPPAIAFAFIDGLHDPDSVRADYEHVLPWLVPGGLLAFHDYFEHFPGLVEAVGELLMDETFALVGYVDWLVVLRRGGLRGASSWQ